jgi:hypothetical protein
MAYRGFDLSGRGVTALLIWSGGFGLGAER